MYVLFIAVALSIDAFGVGMAFGINKIKVPFLSIAVISAIGFLVLSLSVVFGNLFFTLVPYFAAKVITGLIFIIIGLWIIKQGFTEKKKEKYRNIPANILRKPEYGDLNNSRVIEPFEAIFIGLALSFDCVVACVGSNATLLLPALILSFQVLFILLGSALGNNMRWLANTKICILLSGAAMIIIGLIQLA